MDLSIYFLDKNKTFLDSIGHHSCSNSKIDGLVFSFPKTKGIYRYLKVYLILFELSINLQDICGHIGILSISRRYSSGLRKTGLCTIILSKAYRYSTQFTMKIKRIYWICFPERIIVSEITRYTKIVLL